MKKIFTAFIIIITIGILAFGAAKNLVYPLDYKEEIIKYSKQYDIDPYFVAAIIYTESGFLNNFTYKPGGKTGLMQLCDFTAEQWARNIKLSDFEGKSLENPEINIQLGTWYLGNLKNSNSDKAIILEGWVNRNIMTHELKKNNIYIASYTKHVEKIEKLYRILYANNM